MSSVALRERLSAFYACYFGAIGVLLPFWTPYLRHLDFSPLVIGQLMAVMMATRIVTPSLWAWLADCSHRPDRIMRGCALLAPLAFAAVLSGPGPSGMALILGLFGLAWTGLLPQFEANTLNHLGRSSHRYAHVRLWGSVGFIATVLAGGIIFEGAGIRHVPVALLVLFGLTAVAAVSTPVARRRRPAIDPARLRTVLLRPEVACLLTACVLQQASFGPYYVFFTIYVTDLGYAPTTAAMLWAWGVTAEIIAFVYTPRLLQRFDGSSLLLAALAATVVRWAVTATCAGSLPLLFMAQTLHMAGFGLFHAVAISLVHRHFPGRLQIRGQALYSSLGFGLGGVIGSLGAGWVWTQWGGQASFFLATGLALLACVVASGTLRHARARAACGIRGRDGQTV
jgi:PPP family 3-phenylpropionic acid transporter